MLREREREPGLETDGAGDIFVAKNHESTVLSVSYRFDWRMFWLPTRHQTQTDLGPPHPTDVMLPWMMSEHHKKLTR